MAGGNGSADAALARTMSVTLAAIVKGLSKDLGCGSNVFMRARGVHHSVPVARTVALEDLLPLEGLSLGSVGTAGLLLKGTGVLAVNSDQCSGPAIAHFMIAQDEPLGFRLGEKWDGRIGDGNERCESNASEAMLGGCCDSLMVLSLGGHAARTADGLVADRVLPSHAEYQCHPASCQERYSE